MATEISDCKRVLVVDDDPWVCETIREVLASCGYDPFTCTDSGVASGAVNRQSFDLAFLDVEMPEANGIKLALRMKSANPLCRIVLMTGFASLEMSIEVAKSGEMDYLRKPFSPTEVGFLLKRLSGMKATLGQAEMSKEGYQRMVQNAPMLALKMGPHLDLQFVNEACFPLLGFSPQEAMSTPNWIFERIYGEDLSRLSKFIQSAFESDHASFSTECRLAHRDGRPIHFFMKCVPYPENRSGRRAECVDIMAIDITERVQMERTLLKQEKLKTLGSIAAELAHEIRNPLVSIGGFAKCLKKRAPEAPEADIIVREVKRLEELLGRIRSYLRPNPKTAGECSINEVVRNCIDLLAPEINGKEVKCRMELDEGIPVVTLNSDILTQVCINLIRNGLDASGNKKEIVIRTFQSKANLHIDFVNENNGKPMKSPELLFLPLEKGGESIGLPLSHKLLENMGGFLSFEEKEKHVVFTVLVPKEAHPIKPIEKTGKNLSQEREVFSSFGQQPASLAVQNP